LKVLTRIWHRGMAGELAMFERYTEDARRALFFARYKTTERDGDSISGEDLFAGIVLGAPESIQRLTSSRPDALPSSETGEQFLDRMRRDEEMEVRSRKELRFSRAATEALLLAVQEADALGHRHVRPEHLILALLRTTDTDTSQRLLKAGVTLEDVRDQARKREREGE
jgi:ATP-dependent Clp protease ATP-binding subunit ClpC